MRVGRTRWVLKRLFYSEKVSQVQSLNNIWSAVLRNFEVFFEPCIEKSYYNRIALLTKNKCGNMLMLEFLPLYQKLTKPFCRLSLVTSSYTEKEQRALVQSLSKILVWIFWWDSGEYISTFQKKKKIQVIINKKKNQHQHLDDILTCSCFSPQWASIEINTYKHTYSSLKNNKEVYIINVNIRINLLRASKYLHTLILIIC